MKRQDIDHKYTSPEVHNSKVNSDDDSDNADEEIEKKSLKNSDDIAIERGSGLTSCLNCCLKKFKIDIPERYVFGIISFFGFFFVYAMRVNLHVALVAMTGSHFHVQNTENVACRELLPNVTLHSNGTTTRYGEFDWDSTIQNQLLGAFFYGYVITQIPGGIIAERFGGKRIFGLGILVTSIFTLLTPLAARLGVGYLLAVRIIEGLGEGVTYPAMNALIGRWVPKNERSRLATLIFTGSSIGTVISMSLSGLFSSSPSYGGWPMSFYSFGVGGCVWYIVWTFRIFESPQENPRISKSEIQHIEDGQDRSSQGIRGRTPWRAILTSGRVWALVITHFGFNWGFYTLLEQVPTYLSNILHFDMKHNGVLSSIPYLCQALMAQVASAIADRWRACGSHSITTIRKVINSIAFFVPAILIACISLAGCNTTVIISLLMLSVAFSGFMFSGFNVTHVDMSPDFAGTLMGITNCIANMTGFLSPAVVGWITKSGQTRENWTIVFTITPAILVFTGCIFIAFGSAELQPWGVSTVPTASPTDEEASAEKKESPKDNP